MDKTFNDLMDIVNRTKKLDGSDRPRPRPASRPTVEEEEYSPREYDIVEEKPKRTRTVKKDSPNLFAGSSVEKMLEKKTTKSATKKSTTKSTTKKTTKSKSTTKATTKKASEKSETTKKTSTPKVSKPKLTKDDVLSEIEVKLDSPKKNKVEFSTVNADDPKNAQLYEALKNSLFSGGTDISEYMEMENNSAVQSSLQELKAKREAHKINEEITKEQQEYEQLFTGSLGSVFQNTQEEEEEPEIEERETVNVEEKNAQLASELNAIRSNLESKKNNPAMQQASQPMTQKEKRDATYELETGNRDLDKKIAEYYRRKQEKINQYNAMEDSVVEESKSENEPVDYEAIFGGSMMTRDELLGIEKEPEDVVEEPQETVDMEESSEESPVSTQEEGVETTEELDNAVETQEETAPASVEEIVETPVSSEEREMQEDVLQEERVQEETPIVEQPEDIQETVQEGTQESPTMEVESKEEVQEESQEESNSALTEEDYNKLFGQVSEEDIQGAEEDKQEAEEISQPAEEVVQEAEETQEPAEEVEDSEEPVEKEGRIKSLLSELLYNKKIVTNQEKEEENPTEVQEDSDTQEEALKTTQPTSQDYESIWNSTLLGEKATEETNEEKVVESQESAEEPQTVEESQEEPQTVEEPQEELSEEEIIDSLSLNLTGETQEKPQEEEAVSEETTSEETYEESVGIEDAPVAEDSNPFKAFVDTQFQGEEEVQEDTLETVEQESAQEVEAPQIESAPVLEEATIEEAPILEEESQETIEEPQEMIGVEESAEEIEEDDIEKEDFVDSENIAPEQEEDEYSNVPTQTFESEEALGIETEETQENSVYNLSSQDADLDDYIISSNIPSDMAEEGVVADTSKEESNVSPEEEYTETSHINEETVDNQYDEHFESVVNNERNYETSAKKDFSYIEDEEDDNTCVVETLPENKYDLFGNEIIDEEGEEKEEQVVEEKKDDTISKEEFYNEMARLQENLINQLKGQATTESRDFFEEKDPELEKKETENADRLVEDIIEEYNQDKEEEVTTETQEEEIPQVQEEEEEPEVVCKAEPVDPEHYDDYNLLGKEEPLNDEDLEYQEKSEEEKTPEKDACFYLSPEDNEKKSNEVDEYVALYNEDTTPMKEVGDIHIFKTIGNASPSSEILKETEAVEKGEESTADDEEVEAIYTLMGIERKPKAKTQADIKVLYVASECQPFVATGGLGDVAGSLPQAIASKGGVDIRVILPLYSSIKNDYRDQFEYLGNFTVHLSWRQEYCGLFRYYKNGVTYYFVDNERYFKRDKLYGYYDDGERFAYFSKAVVEALPYLNFFPDIIHCNDWQSSLVSAYIKTGNWSDFRYYKIKNIYTIHNVEYQGVYGMENLKDLFGIDYRFRNDMEYNGDINLTKAAIQYSDKFTTVSNSYCDNLKQPYCSRGLHHIIIRNEYKLSGIINGIDYDFYNPATDTSLFKNYDFGCIEDKVLNKKSWQDEMGLPVDGNTPMISIVSRLVNHKGMDLVMKVMEEILDQDIQLVVVGTGEDKYVNYFKYLEGKYPTKVRALVDNYSNENARKAYASSDIFLMPSKIEPCGISQMIASRYGCVPIVREVGGLKDTIRDFGCEGGGNGYTFTNYNPNDLSYQLNRAIRDYGDKTGWREKMKICMSEDFTWKKPADEYIKLYKSLCETL